jgi:hypothetical protein
MSRTSPSICLAVTYLIFGVLASSTPANVKKSRRPFYFNLHVLPELCRKLRVLEIPASLATLLFLRCLINRAFSPKSLPSGSGGKSRWLLSGMRCRNQARALHSGVEPSQSPSEITTGEDNSRTEKISWISISEDICCDAAGWLVY